MDSVAEAPTVTALTEALLAADEACRDQLRGLASSAPAPLGELLTGLAGLSSHSSDEDIAHLYQQLVAWLEQADAPRELLLAGIAARLLARSARREQYHGLSECIAPSLDATEDPILVAAGFVVQIECRRDLVSANDLIRMLEQVIVSAPGDCWLQQHMTNELILLLAFNGMLHESRAVLDLPVKPNQVLTASKSTRIALLIDMVERGQAHLALELWGQLAEADLDEMPDLIQGYMQIARFMVSAEADLAEENPLLAMCMALLERDVDALDDFSKDLDESAIFADSTFYALNPIRLALAQLDASTARKLLEQRTSRARTHFLDDLMWARLALIEGRREQAARTFSRCHAAAVALDAEERLEWELGLAAECRSIDLVALGADLAAQRWPSDTRSLEASLLLADRLRLGLDPSDKPAKRWIGISEAAADVRTWITQRSSLSCISGPPSVGRRYAAMLRHRQHHSTGQLEEIDCERSAMINWSDLSAKLDGAHDDKSGTLVLEHADSLPAPFQRAILMLAELHRMNDDGSSLDIIVIVNQPPQALLAAGKWLPEFALGVTADALAIPALAQRAHDVPLLFLRWLRELGATCFLDDSLNEWLSECAWPGNHAQLHRLALRLQRRRGLLTAASVKVLLDALDEQLGEQADRQ